MASDEPLPEPLVTTNWLADNLGAADLVVIDGSWRLPGGGDARDDYAKRHIPGAVFFPIDEIADHSTPLPHMLAPRDEFEKAVGALGISDRDRIVVYDDQGLFSAARVWWTFKAMGHHSVAVLDGGLPKWLAEGRPTSDVTPTPTAKSYRASPVASLVSGHGKIRDVLADTDGLVLDARPAARFAGEAAEPRPRLRRGHMPNSKSLPASTLLTESGQMKSPAALKAIFEAAGITPQTPVITSCGSGVTAAIISLALGVVGHDVHSLYDGSWAQWGDERNDPALFPVEAGAV